MPKLIDLTGQKFGRLIVIRQAGKNKRRQSRWLCKCDCMQKIIVVGFSLKNGNTKSCGCLQKELTASRSTKHGHTKVGNELELMNHGLI